MSELASYVWQEPSDARTWHVFDEDDNRSLCGKYGLNTSDVGKQALGYTDVEPSNSHKKGHDCKECCQKAGLLDEDGEGDE